MAHNSYSTKVLINNWYEDVELESLRLRDNLDRTLGGGGGSGGRTRGSTARGVSGLEEAAVSVSPDGYLRAGDLVMLFSEQTGGFLACDAGAGGATKTVTGSTAVQVSASHAPSACLRNVVQLARAEDPIDDVDDPWYGAGIENGVDDPTVLCYGDQIRLLTHPRLTRRAMFLHSELASHLSSARSSSRHQAVTMSARPTYATAWKVVHRDPRARLESEGEPIPANTAVVVVHCATGAALASDMVEAVTSHGIELEVCAHTFLDSHKAEQAQNHWLFVTAPDDGSGGSGGGDVGTYTSTEFGGAGGGAVDV